MKPTRKQKERAALDQEAEQVKWNLECAEHNEQESPEPEVLLSFRVPQSLRDNFNVACAALDTTTSQSLRAHMRKVVDDHNARRGAVADAVTSALGGRDSMLVPLADLVKLSRAGGVMGGYVDGIIFARRSLHAAGVEA